MPPPSIPENWRASGPRVPPTHSTPALGLRARLRRVLASLKPRDAGGATISVIRRSATCRPAEPEAGLGANTRTRHTHTTVTRSACKHTPWTCSRAHTRHGRSEAHGHSDTRARTHVRTSTQTVATERTDTRILQCTCPRLPSAFYLRAHVSPQCSLHFPPHRPLGPFGPQFDPLPCASPRFRGPGWRWSCGGGSGKQTPRLDYAGQG